LKYQQANLKGFFWRWTSIHGAINIKISASSSLSGEMRDRLNQFRSVVSFVPAFFSAG
jgi:hypothetical protein